ncbi:Golgi-Associated Olfactory Signaling Regulator [Manis pentadactyla]|nr:Golgi-Associated Olfactory Signaling Regulator [Manis pentadactyla]
MSTRCLRYENPHHPGVARNFLCSFLSFQSSCREDVRCAGSVHSLACIIKLGDPKVSLEIYPEALHDASSLNSMSCMNMVTLPIFAQPSPPDHGVYTPRRQ